MFDIKANGKRVRQYTHNGFTYVEGREGTEYSIEVKNNYSTRKLFVISVDGINVISGKPAKDDPFNGYIVNGYDNLNLRGFRVNDQDVAAFKFVKSNQSYAKGVTGSEQNNGVIGVKVYDEKYVLQPFIMKSLIPQPQPWIIRDYPPIWDGGYTTTCDSCNTGNLMGESFGNSVSSSSNNVLRSCAADISAKGADFNLGTGWGTKQTQSVREVAFEVGVLCSTEVIYYASRQQLEEMGIDLGDKPKIRTVMPSAFGEQKYCRQPSGWRG